MRGTLRRVTQSHPQETRPLPFWLSGPPQQGAWPAAGGTLIFDWPSPRYCCFRIGRFVLLSPPSLGLPLPVLTEALAVTMIGDILLFGTLLMNAGAVLNFKL
ncbi:hypothetical protein H8959_018592 [Pygathrix nigripes]